ncbi:cytidylyltransferase domain-containing protein [Alteromonas sp. H39]|uniref:acylneuraminate cytidylyltransferase family protein n=1 Tax=Alteromonas sp. H39 TaxID=3389876 RepID=UPI0039DF370A
MTEKTVCIIPARGGSKGLPGKNIKALAGKPLIAHSVMHARDAETIDDVYVSSDSNDILSIAAQYGAKPIVRPDSISGDEASSESSLLHALEFLSQQGVEPSLVVFLQCTSPVRSARDIDNAVTTLRKERADSLLSVAASHRFLWQRDEHGVVQSLNYDYRNRPRRQDMQPQYQENGSIYVFTPDVLKTYGNRLGGKVALYEMAEDSCVDIDNEFDFFLAEQCLKEQAEV